MKQIFIFLSLFIFLTNAVAQQIMSLKDATLGAGTYLRPEMPVQLKWMDSNNYVAVKENKLVGFGLKNNKTADLISLDELNAALEFKALGELSAFPAFTFIDESQIWFYAKNKLVILNLKDKTVSSSISFPEGAENRDFNAAAQTLGYTVKNNLFVASTSGTEQLTNDTNPYIVSGTSVHRNEFGIRKGTFWSPTGNQLAFYRMDETMVEDYPLVDFMARQAKLLNIKYPMAGMTSHEVKLGIYNRATKMVVYLKTGAPNDRYLTNISWAPDEKTIFIAELNREQNHMKLNQYDAVSGNFIKTILDEKDEKYVEPQHPIVFSKVDPSKFYYQSRRDGWNHVYLYQADGKKIAQITSGNWEVTELLGFDNEEKNLFFESTKESPIERHLYQINIQSGKTTKLSADAGTHSGQLSPDRKYLIDQWTSTNVPGRIDLISAKGELLKTIHEAPNTLKDYQLGENATFTIKASDETTDLFCRMIKPRDFDPTKKYPVVVYVYGGPHAQLVNKTWHNDARWWQYYMAEKGYIAFTVDSRGSANRGKAFENAIHRRLGEVETADQIKGIDYLKSLPFVDQNRIGVHGWSYGGFMTLNLMLKHPETFKVGVAGGPVVDWSMYEVMYGERYMDTPEENPMGYQNSNMLNHAEKLSGKLMLIHGVQDQTVVMQHSIQFLEKCVGLGKQVDFFVYPTHEHNVRGNDRLHLMEKISNYFLENL